jgi:hypothetical protein
MAVLVAGTMEGDPNAHGFDGSFFFRPKEVSKCVTR